MNLDFDLSLRRGRPPGARDARTRQARELVMQMLLVAVEGDSVLLSKEPQPDFFDYLDRLEIPVPEVCVQPSVTHHARCTPFGWNRVAENVNRLYDDPAPHPPLEIVRWVNCRSFSAEIERRHFGGEHVIGVVRGVDELTRLLEGRPVEAAGWVLKSEHGNGAFGNRRLRTRDLGEADLAALARLFDEDEAAVLEPWRKRVTDLASVFDVDERGNLTSFRAYEVVNTAEGALIGDIFDRSSPAVERWRAELEGMSSIVAAELAAAGYYGPVCVDSFVWKDEGVERLRPVVDINARLFMAAAAERLWRLWGRDRVVYWRLFSRRKLECPGTFGELENTLGDAAYDPATRCGVLVTSPLEIDGRRPRRIGVVLAGTNRNSVDTLDRWFRGRLGR